MKSYVWSNGTFSDGKEFMLQIENFTSKSEDAIMKVMEGWSVVSTGFVPSGNRIRVFRRTFATTQELERWAITDFRWSLLYVLKNGLGKTRKMKTTKKRAKSTCAKCGKAGHNSRTCTSSKKPKVKKVPKLKRITRNKNKCGKCGDYGHNARTCVK